MQSLSPEAVRALAPDAGALKAGQSLAGGRGWSALGRSDDALWGRCQGSGKNPYEVSVDLDGLASKCTCPSRKFPCKHALGLMFMAASGALGDATAEPEGVAAWRADRAKRAASAANRSDGSVDDEKTQRAKARERERRAAQRDRRVEAGLADFRRWLDDLARRGLADLTDLETFDTAAARLVDAQAGELARDVRALRRVVARDGVGADEVLDRLGLLFLVCETFERRAGLDPPLAAELRARVGWTVREADLPTEGDIVDRWFVVARRHEFDDRLCETRTWLRGDSSDRWALILDFAPARTEPANEPPVGAAVEGRIGFYPGASVVRGALRAGFQSVDALGDPTGSADLATALTTYAAAVSKDPFLERWPTIIDQVDVAWDRDTKRLALIDRAGMAVPARFLDESVAPFIAFSGGRPVRVAGEWDGHALDVLAVGDGASWISLPGTERPGVPARIMPDTTVAEPHWAALQGMAMLGTARAAPDPVLAPLVERMADRAPEERLLALISALAVRRRVSQRPAPAVDGPPRLAPAPTEVRSRPPRGVTQALLEMTRRDLRDQRLASLLSEGWLVPPELLPLEWMSPPIAQPAALGRRAGWLSRYVSGYRPWGVEVEPVDPGAVVARLEDTTVSPVERLATFRAYRSMDPNAARTWLASAWSGLTANDKMMVAGLEVGLSGSDEAFLDGVLAERNQDRRAVVTGLLARVPGSAFVGRLESRGRTLVERKGRFQSGLRLVPVSDAMFAEMDRDGSTVAEKFPGGGPVRPREDRSYEAFCTHLRLIAPSRWCDWLGLSAEQIVRESDALAPNQWGQRPSDELAMAAVRHADAPTAVAILSGGHPSQRQDELWALVPATERAALALKLLKDSETDMRVSLDAALRAQPRPWDPRFAATVDAEIAQSIGRLAGRARWNELQRLRAFAVELPVELLPAFIDRIDRSEADTRDIAEIADARRRFAAAVAEAQGTR